MQLLTRSGRGRVLAIRSVALAIGGLSGVVLVVMCIYVAIPAQRFGVAFWDISTVSPTDLSHHLGVFRLWLIAVLLVVVVAGVLRVSLTRFGRPRLVADFLLAFGLAFGLGLPLDVIAETLSAKSNPDTGTGPSLALAILPVAVAALVASSVMIRAGRGLAPEPMDGESQA